MTGETEEPVDETADAARFGDRPAGLFTYLLLTDADRSALRMERAHHLEAELYRLELALAEATDNAEREHLANRAEALLQRLRVHLAVLSGTPSTTPGETDSERRTPCSRDQS